MKIENKDFLKLKESQKTPLKQNTTFNRVQSMPDELFLNMSNSRHSKIDSSGPNSKGMGINQMNIIENITIRDRIKDI